MAHYAKLNNGKVEQVIVVHNNELLVNGVEVESKGAEFCTNLFGGEWVQTSYNAGTRFVNSTQVSATRMTLT
jgi:hypothetical protein